jgi:hypothetical protein
MEIGGSLSLLEILNILLIVDDYYKFKILIIINNENENSICFEFMD